MSIHRKVHDTLRTILILEEFPVIVYGISPEPSGGNFRAITSIGDTTIKADGLEAAPVQLKFKDAADNKLTAALKTDVDVRHWVMVVTLRDSVDAEPFLKTLGRTIPADVTLGTPILYMRVASADIELPPAVDPSSGTYIRAELEITAAPVASV